MNNNEAQLTLRSIFFASPDKKDCGKQIYFDR